MRYLIIAGASVVNSPMSHTILPSSNFFISPWVIAIPVLLQSTSLVMPFDASLKPTFVTALLISVVGNCNSILSAKVSDNVVLLATSFFTAAAILSITPFSATSESSAW